MGNDMKTILQVLEDSVAKYIEYFINNKIEFKIEVVPHITYKLPKEFIKDGFITLGFSGWLSEQIVIEDGLFRCLIPVEENNEWVEIPVDIPLVNIMRITNAVIFDKHIPIKEYEESMSHLKR